MGTSKAAETCWSCKEPIEFCGKTGWLHVNGLDDHYDHEAHPVGKLSNDASKLPSAPSPAGAKKSLDEVLEELCPGVGRRDYPAWATPLPREPALPAPMMTTDEDAVPAPSPAGETASDANFKAWAKGQMENHNARAECLKSLPEPVSTEGAAGTRCGSCGVPIMRLEGHPGKWTDANGFIRMDYHDHAPADERLSLRHLRETLVLPCPFCGSDDIDPEGWANSEGVHGPACNFCGASAGTVSDTDAENIAAWNTRKPSAEGDGWIADGVALIAAERKRQIESEGWTPEHDDLHAKGELSLAACGYASLGSHLCHPNHYSDDPLHPPISPRNWPWGSDWWKPSSDPIRNLVKAGALIAAEIDRLKRLPAPPSGQGEVK